MSKTRRSYAVLYVNDARPIVVSLEPGDEITFREAGRRHLWSESVDRVFRQAVLRSGPEIAALTASN